MLDEVEMRYMEDLDRLSNDLAVLSEFIQQHHLDIKKEQLNPKYLRMVSPSYERELLAVTRIQKYLKQIYDGAL